MFDNQWMPGIGGGLGGIAPQEKTAPSSNEPFPCTAAGLERVQQQIDALLGLLTRGPSRKHIVADDRGASLDDIGQ